MRLYDEEKDYLNYYVFLNDDGTKTIYFFEFPVKCVNEKGLITDIDFMTLNYEKINEIKKQTEILTGEKAADILRKVYNLDKDIESVTVKRIALETEENIENSIFYSVTYAINSSLLSDDTYYINNRYSGKYLCYSSASVTCTSGYIAVLGNSIRWEIKAINGGYVIRSKSDTTKYLGVPTDSNSQSLVVVSVTNGAVPTRCIWNITASSVGGCIIKNTYNSMYLCTNGDYMYTTSSIGSTDSNTYDRCVWRVASTSYYGNTPGYTKRELENGFSINSLVVDIGTSQLTTIIKNPTNSLWADSNDFTYSYLSGTSGSVTFNSQNGRATGVRIGVARYMAKHKVTGRTYTFNVYVDNYTYSLIYFWDFDSTSALLIRNLYDKIDENYSAYSTKYRAWMTARLLSEFCYDDTDVDLGIIIINRWDDVAGSVTSNEDRYNFFVDTLGYSTNEYNILNNSLNMQHTSSLSSDFVHMQFSLAARLAYVLSLDGFISNIYTGADNEYVSYLAGWPGDAALLQNGTTHLGNADYTADLDAENLYRMVNSGNTSIYSFNTYYKRIDSGTTNRAVAFKSYLGYTNVESLVLSKLNKSLEQVRNQYPDTYDFLRSLYNNQNELNHY